MPINQTPPLESLYKAARGRGVEFAEEFVPITRTFDASELRLSYTEWGDPGLPTVVMLHGFAQTSHAWDLITLGLADRFHLISLDQRGHGDSQWATDGDYSLETQQQDLDEFIKSLGVRRLILVGLSMGGRNAYVFASRNPQLISNLVVVDTGPQGIRSGRSRIRNFVTMPDELDTFEEFVERVHSFVPHRSLEQISNSLLNNIRQMENGKWKVGLREHICLQLTDMGIPSTNLIASDICTFESPDYHSFRRDGEESGRMYAFMALK